MLVLSIFDCIRSLFRANITSTARYLFTVAGFALVSAVSPAFAQGGSPVPGGWNAPQATEPSNSAPLPGLESVSAQSTHNFASGVPAANSKYAQLPLSIFDAKSRMSELRAMANAGRAQDVLDAVNRLSEWLADMCDAHNKMASVFSKHEQTKNQAASEKQAVLKFSQVRNQAQLLKAELLMQQHRFPEALTPLVDIVIAEPTSATGMAAYGKLKELGFAEESSPTEATAPATPTQASTAAAPVSVALKRIQVKNAATAQAPPLRRIR